MDALAGHVTLDLKGSLSNAVQFEETADVTLATFRGLNLVARGSKVESGARLTNTIVGSDCYIEAGAVIENAVLWNGVRVGRNAHITSAVACNNVAIGSTASIGENVFIGEGAQIGEGADVRPNVKLWPGKRVEAGAKLTTSLVWQDEWNRELFTNSRISGTSNVELIPELSAKVGASLGALS